MNTSRSCTAVLALLLSPACAWGWGPNGHRVVGEIAERHLSDHARRQIAALLDGDGLAELSTWPDDIRSDPGWDRAKPWHFVSIDDQETLATTARDPQGDVLEALHRLEAVLRDPQAERERKVEALHFYVHFAGDVHQPLHVGRRDDLGGNKIRVKWFREPSNLHSVWDQGLIESQKLSFTELVRFIDDRTPREVAAWQAAPYEEWVKESFCLRGRVYDFGREAPANPGQEPELGFGYAFATMAIVEEQLVKAGVRLAARLDAIFAGEPAPAPPAAVPSSANEWCGR
ncbi:MAG TPA: S1/P1 nuclease [Thermoanaerobaculia bacterium]|nr:S1/P1 nuclease [Thermoanaerobaculia bacterium]